MGHVWLGLCIGGGSELGEREESEYWQRSSRSKRERRERWKGEGWINTRAPTSLLPPFSTTSEPARVPRLSPHSLRRDPTSSLSRFLCHSAMHAVEYLPTQQGLRKPRIAEAQSVCLYAKRSERLGSLIPQTDSHYRLSLASEA